MQAYLEWAAVAVTVTVLGFGVYQLVRIWCIRLACPQLRYLIENGQMPDDVRQQVADLALEAIRDDPYSLVLGQTDPGVTGNWLAVPGAYRSTHTYIVGASGSGKSGLLKNLIIQDIQNGMGLAVVDPHGDLVRDLIPFCAERASDLVLLDLADTQHMLRYNPLELRDGVPVAEQTAKLILAFKRIWGDSWGPRMEDILRHTLTLLIEQGFTLAEFESVFVDGDFRDYLLENTSCRQASDFFLNRYEKWNTKERHLFAESSLNKVSSFLADDRIGLPLSHHKSDFNIKEMMDNGGVLLVNLAKGHLASNADLFGALLMADIETSFLARSKADRRPFALYVDEFQNIATESFEAVLAEARKFQVCLTIAHQSLGQLDEKLISLILGNAQTQVYFRVSRQDAERLAKESENVVWQLVRQDSQHTEAGKSKRGLAELWEIAFHRLVSLQARHAYVHVKGALEKPVMLRTINNPPTPDAEPLYDDKYSSQQELKDTLADLRDHAQKIFSSPEQAPCPDDLEFLDAR